MIPNSATQRLIDAIISDVGAAPSRASYLARRVNGDGLRQFHRRRSWFAAEPDGQRPGHGGNADRDGDLHGGLSRGPIPPATIVAGACDAGARFSLKLRVLRVIGAVRNRTALFISGALNG